MNKTVLYITLITNLLVSCKYPFEAELKFNDSGRLVVEGYIDVGPKAVTHIMLSRTTAVNEIAQLVPEQGAVVSIEDANSNSFPLSETTPGNYHSDSLNLPHTKLYRLKIVSDEKVYFSEFIEPILTPEIDSVSWKESAEGVHISVSTHDPENKTKFYQWTYQEVWEVESAFYSYCKYEDGKFVPRTAQEIKELKTCWVYVAGKEVNVLSSEKYGNDIIPLHSVKFIPRFDPRLNIRYSIFVRQHALSEEALTFYELLKKTGKLGTFSDPMPTELPRNLYRVDSDEPLVGFIGVYTTQTSRIEIHQEQLNPDRRADWNWIIPESCFELENPVSPAEFLMFSKSFQTTSGVFQDGVIVAAGLAPIKCVDCRAKGGTNLRPEFWEYGIENE